MKAPITIRNAQVADFEELVRIESLNFSPEEAASPAAIKERLALIPDTFLVAELERTIAGYIVGPAVFSRHLTDDLFSKVVVNPPQAGYIAIQSLSVNPDFQGQGIGTLLLAALKERAREQNRQGINLTCHDVLIPFYEMNGFVDEGVSESVHGGATWYDMVWENPFYRSQS